MITNRQRNKAALAKERARREAKAARVARILQAKRAWNWQWCDNRNRWQTSSTQPKAAVETCYTATGPSKRTVMRRAARSARRRH